MSFIHDIYEFRKSFCHIVKLTLRCVHLKNAVEFNETCLNNGIFPKYCHIYIYIYYSRRNSHVWVYNGIMVCMMVLHVMCMLLIMCYACDLSYIPSHTQHAIPGIPGTSFRLIYFT